MCFSETSLLTFQSTRRHKPEEQHGHLHHHTELRGRVINTPASYYGGLGFKSRTWRPAFLIEDFRSFLQSLQANAGILP
jgi:hypothetical protein